MLRFAPRWSRFFGFACCAVICIKTSLVQVCAGHVASTNHRSQASWLAGSGVHTHSIQPNYVQPPSSPTAPQRFSAPRPYTPRIAPFELLNKRYYSTDNGLPNNTINGLVQTPDGLVKTACPITRYAALCNLSAEDQQKLFGKFARLSAQRTGGEHSTGLGLSIMKKLVEAMNGRVWCESEEGKGATFVVELPAGSSTSRSVGA
jgi:hypothetical protein